jgi:hypothetical protein
MVQQLDVFGGSTKISAPRNELAEKKAVLRKMEPIHHAELEIMRRAARRYVHTNQSMVKYGIPNIVTASEIREILGIKPERHNRYFTGRNNRMGCLFRCEGWVCVGNGSSKTPGSKGATIKRWTLEQYAKTVRSFIESQKSLTE